MNLFKILSEARRIVKERQKAEVDAKEKRLIAKHFNDRYTYRLVYDTGKDRLKEGSAMYGIMPKGGYAWMCPVCNKIHAPYESSVFDGLHYPACCNSRNGNRLYEIDKIRTS